MLALYEILNNEEQVAKRVLCVDLGNVLIKFDEHHLAKLLNPERFHDFIELYTQKHDKGLWDLWDFYHELEKNKYFNQSVSWVEFVAAYNLCIADVNYLMYSALTKLKEEGRARIVCITDNNPFCFYQTALKFPGIFEIFRENGIDQWMLSYKLKSLKREINPFIWACSKFGFSRKNACFVDDNPINLEAAVKYGFRRNACFLYKLGDPKNHAQFEKFLDKHFPPR